MSSALSYGRSHFIRCRDCKRPIVNDASEEVRIGLERLFGDMEADRWTVNLVCPPCLKVIEDKVLTSPASSPEQTSQIADRAAVELLELAIRWADNKCHGYEFTRDAAQIVQRALDTVEAERGAA